MCKIEQDTQAAYIAVAITVDNAANRHLYAIRQHSRDYAVCNQFSDAPMYRDMLAGASREEIAATANAIREATPWRAATYINGTYGKMGRALRDPVRELQDAVEEFGRVISGMDIAIAAHDRLAAVLRDDPPRYAYARPIDGRRTGLEW